MGKKAAQSQAASACVQRNDFRHENLGRLLMESFRYFRERTLHNLRAHGFHDLTPVHAAMLRRIDESGTKIGVIAERMGVTKQAAAQLVVKAEALGYVACRSDPQDSRAKMVRCTTKGRRFLRSLEDVVEGSIRDIERLIGSARLHELEQTLKLIAGRGRAQPNGPRRRNGVAQTDARRREDKAAARRVVAVL